jgi:hypothetical protein
MAKDQNRQIAAPQECDYRQSMVVAWADYRPHRQDRKREDKRFQKKPGKAQITAPPARLKLAHEYRPKYSPLDRPTSSETVQFFLLQTTVE